MTGTGAPLTPAAGSAPTSTSPLLLLFIFIAALLPLFATPVLPFIDFYNHMARYHVLATIDADPALAANYRAAWAILPNIGFDVIATALLAVVPQAALAHVVAVLIFAVQYGGILALNRQIGGRTHWLTAVLIVPLLYSFILNWGFANFLLGLGMLFWGVAWWLRMRRRPAIAVPVAIGLATLIFLIHGLAFALYGLTLGALELGLWWRERPRRVLPLLTAMAALAVQAVVPVILFRLAATSSSPEGLTNADETARRLARAGQLFERLQALASYRLTTILRVAEGPSLWFDILTLAATAAILVLLLRRRSLGLPGWTWPALALGLGLVLLTPPALFGVGYIADRMPLFLAMLLVACLTVSQPPPRALMLALAGLVGVRVLAIALAWSAYRGDDRDFETVARALPPGALVESLFTHIDRLDPMRRCQMFGPRLIAEHQAMGRLFANLTQQPLRLQGPLAAAVAASGRPSAAERRQPDYFPKVVAAAARGGFDWLLLCDGVNIPLPAGSRIIAQAGRFTLVRLPE